MPWNGDLEKTDGQLRLEIESNESLAGWGAWAVVVGLVLEVAFATAISLGYRNAHIENWGGVLADFLVALGVVCEIHFERRASRANAELGHRSDARVAHANARAEEASKAAEAERHERLKLEAQLQPRSLTKEQFEIIQGLRGKISNVSIAYETDAETSWYAIGISNAFLGAGIKVVLYPRAANIHTFGMLLYDPRMIGAQLSRDAQALSDIFRSLGAGLAIVTRLPEDIAGLPAEVPAIIVGGRFLVSPFPGAAAIADATSDPDNEIAPRQ